MSSLVLGLQRMSLPALYLSAPYYGIFVQPHIRDFCGGHTGQAKRTHMGVAWKRLYFCVIDQYKPWRSEIVPYVLELVPRMYLYPS
jgi:hypothetical protein